MILTFWHIFLELRSALGYLRSSFESITPFKYSKEGLIKLVKGQPAIQVVGQAANDREAIEQARKLAPEVVVMDISMPEMDGIEATRRIKAEFSAVRIIGLTMHDDPQTDLCHEAGGS
jgi:DNA-binding NarL/FixJ family response regulator